MAKDIFLKIREIYYYIPELNPEEEVLWNIIYRHNRKGFPHLEDLKHSVWTRMKYSHRLPTETRELFERIQKVEDKGSKMAFKIIPTHPNAPIFILGIDAETHQLFDAKYAVTENQRLEVMHACEAFVKLNKAPFIPEVLQFKSGRDYSFIKTLLPNGKKLPENVINDSIIDHLVLMSNYTMNSYDDNKDIHLMTSMSNGAFAPWYTFIDKEGKYHSIQWNHTANRPLGYDLLYFIFKPYLANQGTFTSEELEEHIKWLEKFYSHFDIDDFSAYIDANSQLYAARLDSERRYAEANDVRRMNREILEYYHKRTGLGDEKILSRKRVLFIMHMPPPVHGASMVGKWIHDSKHINSKFDCYYLNLTVASNIFDIGKVRFNKLLDILSLNSDVRKAIKSIKPELVYITPNSGGMPFLKDCITVSLAKNMGCYVITHFHNKGVSLYKDNFLFKRLYRYFFNGIKVLLIVPSLYDDNRAFLRIKDLYFCPNGTPDSVKEDISAERHHKVPELLFLSNMIPSKGVFDLLDALYLVRGMKYKFHCTMIGAETPELSRAAIEEEIRIRHLTNHVDYVGPRYGDEKNAYFLNADMMVFPTYYPKECFPLVILEAMEYKLPVVSTKEAGIPYSVIDGKTGLLCKSRNPINLSEKIMLLLDNPELRWKMGEEGYQLRKSKYTLKTFEKNFADVLERALFDIVDEK